MRSLHYAGKLRFAIEPVQSIDTDLWHAGLQRAAGLCPRAGLCPPADLRPVAGGDGTALCRKRIRTGDRRPFRELQRMVPIGRARRRLRMR